MCLENYWNSILNMVRAKDIWLHLRLSFLKVPSWNCHTDCCRTHIACLSFMTLQRIHGSTDFSRPTALRSEPYSPPLRSNKKGTRNLKQRHPWIWNKLHFLQSLGWILNDVDMVHFYVPMLSPCWRAFCSKLKAIGKQTIHCTNKKALTTSRKRKMDTTDLFELQEPLYPLSHPMTSYIWVFP